MTARSPSAPAVDFEEADWSTDILGDEESTSSSSSTSSDSESDGENTVGLNTRSEPAQGRRGWWFLSGGPGVTLDPATLIRVGFWFGAAVALGAATVAASGVRDVFAGDHPFWRESDECGLDEGRSLRKR
ncbi:unnamed protein product [Prorocentrum cordatum]|nr:unnamed protein product [Polarella glacialis]